MDRILQERKLKRAERRRAQMAASPSEPPPGLVIELAPGDPLAGYFDRSLEVAEVNQLEMDSPALRQLKQHGVRLIAPLVVSGKLLGILNLGPGLDSLEYSAMDRQMIANLVARAVSAGRLIHWVRDHPLETHLREQLERDQHLARLVQDALLPQAPPELAGWELDALLQPAANIAGDFYDMLVFPDRRVAIFAGDVAGHGLPAVLIAAITRSVLRSAASRYVAPERVLELANSLLFPDMPYNMFVSCLYAVLDPTTGYLRVANAGYPPPYWGRSGQIRPLQVTGLPLGLMPLASYRSFEITLRPGDQLLLVSDGLTQARGAQAEWFGARRVLEVANAGQTSDALFSSLLGALAGFTGPGWEQEDDIDMVTVNRMPEENPSRPQPGDAEQTLVAFTLSSEPGNERLAVEKTAEAIGALRLPERQVERIKTAVSETTMNAIEHGNHNVKDKPVDVLILMRSSQLLIRVTDHGGSQPIPERTEPDLEAKLAGLQSPRGWGLFLIRHMVDEMAIFSDELHHTVELGFNLEGATHDGQAH
jgi:serine phosphatase RsbU (regulator of sigma subunit)/anti-sigma regulatory factor (Ser/Thr protein kinase)